MSVLIFNSRVFSKDSEWTASQWYLQFSIKLRLFSVETYSSIQQLNWKFSSDTTLSYFLSVFHVIVYFSSVLQTVQVILRFILWSDHLWDRHVDAGCQYWLILVLLWHKHPEQLHSYVNTWRDIHNVCVSTWFDLPPPSHWCTRPVFQSCSWGLAPAWELLGRVSWCWYEWLEW